MIGHADGRAVAYLEVGGAYRYAALAQAIDLIEQMLKVDNDSRAEHIHGVIAQYARRQQIQDKLSLVVHHGVTGVVAALITDNNIILFREQIDHTALALIAPVGSHDRS